MDSYYNSSNSNTENNLNFKQLKATLTLLTSSILVSVSGALRVYIAALLLGTHVSILVCAASFLIIYSVYTLDRTLDSEEDEINRVDLDGAIKECGFVAVICTFLIGAYLFAQNGILWVALLPFVTGILYSKGIKIGRFALKLKGGLGVKNVITGITWGLSIVGAAGIACKSILALMILFLYFGVKLFVNSTIYDFSDIKGDIKAGIKTLPVCFGERLTKKILLLIHIISHGILYSALTIGIIAFKPWILIYSFINGLICIGNYTNVIESNLTQIIRTLLVDGESSIIVALTLIQGIFFA